MTNIHSPEQPIDWVTQGGIETYSSKLGWSRKPMRLSHRRWNHCSQCHQALREARTLTRGHKAQHLFTRLVQAKIPYPGKVRRFFCGLSKSQVFRLLSQYQLFLPQGIHSHMFHLLSEIWYNYNIVCLWVSNFMVFKLLCFACHIWICVKHRIRTQRLSPQKHI